MTHTFTDSDALLAAIRESPQDDAPRLIYADWLDENGQAERAEFLRVQCELAAMERRHYLECTSTTKRSMESNSLRRRERELWRANWQDWFGEQHDLLFKNQAGEFGVGTFRNGNGGYEFSRGFLSRVTCRMEDWVGRMCPNCDVSPGIRRYGTLDGDWIEGTCNECNGTGRIPGHGPAVVRWAASAVKAVTFSDVRVHDEGGLSNDHRWAFYEQGHEATFAVIRYANDWYDFESAPLDALSRAAIEWAWKEGG